MSATPTTALAPIEPSNMSELERFAAAAAKSTFFGAKTQEQALMIAMAGRDLGLSYAQALRAFHVVEGRPAMSADGMVAVCLGRPDICTYFRTVTSTDAACTVETQRAGEPEPRRLTFSMEDAKRAGVAGKGNWSKYPAAMLRARAKSALARDVYPDLLLGLYDPDELAPDDRRPARVTVVEPVAAERPEATPAEVVDAEVVAPPEPPRRSALDVERERLRKVWHAALARLEVDLSDDDRHALQAELLGAASLHDVDPAEARRRLTEARLKLSDSSPAALEALAEAVHRILAARVAS